MRNLAHAARPLANDLASSLLFAGLVALKAPPMVATLAAIGFGIGHVAWMKATRRPIAPLQWASLALVLVFGSVSLFLHDVRFLMAKPTVIYLIIAVVMLKPGWMLRYMPPIARQHGERAMIAFGYVWAALMVVTAAANLLVAIAYPAFWPAFMAVFPIGSKLALFAIQFTTVRAIVRPKVMAETAAATQAA
jgi:intracellular septation protein A